MTELEKQAQKFLEETDTVQFSEVELLTMFYKHQQQLNIGVIIKHYSGGHLELMQNSIINDCSNEDKKKGIAFAAGFAKACKHICNELIELKNQTK